MVTFENMKQITANLATYPERKESLKKVVAHLLTHPFITQVRVCLNQYDSVPADLPNDARVFYHIPETDLKASGKFYWANTLKNEYYFSCDDDLLYSASYFFEHIKALEMYGNAVFVTSHGKIMPQHPASAAGWLIAYPCLRNQAKDAWINNPGTGAMVFDNSQFTIPRETFKYHNMADLTVGIFLQRQKIPVLCRKHQADELQYLPQKTTIWNQRKKLHPLHMEVINEIPEWNLYKTV